jgi:ABC-type Zn uptake system ZnuABC Zn-binding protein ZnuA
MDLMKRWFKWGIGVVAGLTTFWVLNVPFLDSQQRRIPLIATSSPMLSHLATIIMGPDIQTWTIMDSPYDTTISMEKKSAIADADVILVHGGGLEPSEILNEIPPNKQIINIYELMSPNEKKWSRYYWMNPFEWNKVIHHLQIRLKSIFPKRESEINYRKNAYSKEVYRLFSTLRDTLTLPLMATNHDSFVPFAQAFGIECLVFDIDHAHKNEQLGSIVAELKNRGISVFFPNADVSQNGLDALVELSLSQGWPLVIAPPVVTLRMDNSTSYIEFIVQNATTLRMLDER